MSRIKINRGTYVAIVMVVAVAAGISIENGSPLARMAMALALPVLTFPLGVIGALCALPLIYMGIATVSEAHFVAAPIYALAGMLQWYILLPKAFGARSNKSLDSGASRRSA